MKKPFIIMLLIAILFPQLSVAKEKSIKMGKTVVYSGEVADKKTPSGVGFIVFNNQTKNASKADTISGRFEMQDDVVVVFDAKASFANGAKFSGMASIIIETLSEKPAVEKITCTLIGCLDWPGNPIMTGDFNVCRKTDCGENTFELILDPVDTKEVQMMIYRHGAYKGELKNGSVPDGEGMLSVVSANHYETNNVIDVIKGRFDGNNVTNAKLTFNSGYKFFGDLNYEVSEKGDDEIFLYHLNGYLVDNKNYCVFCDTSFVLKRHTDFNALRTNIEDFEGTSCIQSLNKEFVSLTGCDTIKVSRRLRLSEKTAGIWNQEFSFAEAEPVFYYTNGVVATVFHDGVSVDREDASFVVKGDHLTEFIKEYEEGFFHYVKGGQSQIIYKDGSRYEGTLSISSARKRKSLEDELAAFIEVPRMNDYRIMYLNGTTIFANGKKDTWKNGVTDYQANKIAGNYEGRKKLLAQTLQEEARAAEKAWEDARPLFEKDYGERYVDALYGYRLIEGMPLSMFKRVKEMGLPYYDLIGPFSTNHGPFNQYVITVWNRQTNEVQYQKSIYFDKFNRLYKTSNRF